MDHRRLHSIGVSFVFLTGLLVALTGIWFILSTHPFESMWGAGNGYAEEFGLSLAEVEEFNPNLASWTIHVSDQVGSLSLGWGVFVMALAVLEYFRQDRALQLVILIGALPTLVFSALEEFLQFEGYTDPGTVLSAIVLVLFLVGVGLMYLGTRSETAVLRR